MLLGLAIVVFVAACGSSAASRSDDNEVSKPQPSMPAPAKVAPDVDYGHGILFFSRGGVVEGSIDKLSLYLDEHPDLEMTSFSIDSVHSGVYALVRSKQVIPMNGGGHDANRQ